MKDYNRKTGLVECINSHGDVDQFPRVTMADVLHIYRVTISGFERVKKASLPSTAPVPSLNKCVQNTHCSSVKGIVSDLDNCKRAETICKTWSKPYKNPTLCEVKEAAELAEQGFLTSLKRMVLLNLDVTSIPSEQLSHLASIVTDEVFINDVRGDVNCIFSSLTTDVLNIDNMTISAMDTIKLVDALISNVKKLQLGWRGQVTLDVDDVTHYDGLGKCKIIWCYNDTGDRYKEKLRRLAQKINWKVREEDNGSILISR